MSLDFAALATQIADMLDPYAESLARRAAVIDSAKRTLLGWTERPAEVAVRIQSCPKSLPIAVPLGPLHEVVPAPAAPRSYAVVAVDGSQIDVDRHAALTCYLLNFGTVVLRYGECPGARLANHARLSFREDDLFAGDDSNPAERERVQGAVLAAKRFVEESRVLRELIELEGDGPVLGLADNALVPWSLLGKQIADQVRGDLLRDYAGDLQQVAALAERRSVLLAGYVSKPNNSQVVNLIRLLATQAGQAIRPDDPLATVTDRELFARLLASPGDRSAVYESPWFRREFARPVQEYFEANPFCCFYLWTGDEVARVEVPRWIATDRSRLNLVHALVVDQLRRGEGYPVGLAEAHEQAVVTGSDRALFWELVERMAVEQRIILHPSAKALAKRARGV